MSGYDNPAVWATGADPIYEQLSRAAIASIPLSISGRLVLDIGAGTGATTRAIARSHAWPVAIDTSHAMLAHGSGSRPPAVAADATRLPFADGAVGAAIAAFCLSHVDEPQLMLSELARVVEAGGPVLAVVFADNGARHPVADVVAKAATMLGWTPPPWYRHLKDDLEPAVADPNRLRSLGIAAGLDDVTVTETNVYTDITDPAALIAWRLAGPALAPFFAELSPRQQKRLVTEATCALGDEPSSLLLRIRTLSGLSSVSATPSPSRQRS